MAKWQKIKYDGKGKPFVTFYGNRLNLDLFQLVNGPLFYCDSAFSCYSLEIDESFRKCTAEFFSMLKNFPASEGKKTQYKRIKKL